MRIYVDRRLGDARELISFSETLVTVQEFYPHAVDYRPGARLPVDFRRLDESEVDTFTASLDDLSIEDELDFVAIFRCDLNSETHLDFTPFFSLSSVRRTRAIHRSWELPVDYGRSGIRSEAGVAPRLLGRP